MKQQIDIKTWERRELFQVFSVFEEPFYGVCVSVDCTKAYLRAKELKTSFFLYYLHKSLTAANMIQHFRYRIEDGQVYLYDRIDAATTVDRPDKIFAFSGNVVFNTDYKIFEHIALEEIDRVRKAESILNKCDNNTIHYSAVPWINFTSMSHARRLSIHDSCPKISFGKMMEQNGVRTMPMSIHVHHALVDGFHLGQYIDLFQKIMDE
ncbi:MAG: hypothetical protein RL662_204 [Bacteroidota bacterium]|jgi:chloramphenicol O-acetyltransferase type A